MKKFIVAMAAMAMTAGFAVKADVCEQPCKDKKQCDVPCANRPCNAAPDCEAACPFDNLNLTDAQKEQFKALRAKKVEACKARKQDKKAARAECRRAALAEIKAILTPEQYVQFLENNFVDKSRNRAVRHHAMRPDGPRRECLRQESVKASKLTPAKAVKAEKAVKAK